MACNATAPPWEPSQPASSRSVRLEVRWQRDARPRGLRLGQGTRTAKPMSLYIYRLSDQAARAASIRSNTAGDRPQ